MSKHNLPPSNTFNSQSKGNNSASQKQTIFEYLQKNVATASMVTAATGVPKKCITRYKRDLEKGGELWRAIRVNGEETGLGEWHSPTGKSKRRLIFSLLKRISS